MIDEKTFNRISMKAKKLKFSSMDYIEYEDCQNAEVLCEQDCLILLIDKTNTPAMLHFSADNFETVLKLIEDMPGDMRLHFVPHQYKSQLEQLGFIEWSEYVDFFNKALADTYTRFAHRHEIEYLSAEECEQASLVSQKCRLQSRGFEGESKEWFTAWTADNNVIVLRVDAKIVGYCCVSIYNEGTTLWIREIAVEPTFQGKGLGKRLMEQAICYGVENGAVTGFLAADVLNKNAISLYENYGFHAKDTTSELQMLR